jgi:integrase
MSPPKPDRRRLSKAVVAALKPHPDRPRLVWDSTTPGLALRVMPSGVKSFIFQARTKAGRQLKLTIGRCPDLTVEQAREQARRYRATVQLDGDPAQDRRDARAAERARRQEPILEEIWAEWLREHALKRKRPSSLTGDASLWRAHISPVFGRARLSTISEERVRRWHAGIAAPYSANRALSLLATLMAFAVRHRLVVENPAAGVQRHPEHRRDRALSLEQLHRLLAYLEEQEDLASRCLRFMALTGCRRGEALGTRWGHFDLGRARWRKPAALCKGRREHVSPLSPAAMAVLSEVGPGAPDRMPFPLPEHTLRAGWLRACRAVGIEGFRVHDLRHSFISLAIAAGVAPAIACQLAGHTDLAITARYVHGVDHAQREAVEQVAEADRRARAGGDEVVVPLKQSEG